MLWVPAGVLLGRSVSGSCSSYPQPACTWAAPHSHWMTSGSIMQRREAGRTRCMKTIAGRQAASQLLGAGGVRCCSCLSAAVAIAAVTVVLSDAVQWRSAISQGVGRTYSPFDAVAYSSIASAGSAGLMSFAAVAALYLQALRQQLGAICNGCRAQHAAPEAPLLPVTAR
jgi:hypothetical protein